MTDLVAHHHVSEAFSTLDMKKRFYQIPGRAKDFQKAAVITPAGLWDRLCMPIGFRKDGQFFQRLTDKVGAGLCLIFICLDDIFIARTGEVLPQDHLRGIFQSLHEQTLIINLSKCVFAQPAVSRFLGSRVSDTGAEPLIKHLETIQAFPQPPFCTMRTYKVSWASALRGGKNTRLNWSSEMKVALWSPSQLFAQQQV
jgi:hypothetical protein